MTVIAVYAGDAALYDGDRADYYAVEDIDLHVSDAKYRRLTTSGYLQLHVSDKEMAWLTDYVTGQALTPSGQFSDLWYQAVGDSEQFNDNAVKWLAGLGYQLESLADMWFSFWNDPTELP